MKHATYLFSLALMAMPSQAAPAEHCSEDTVCVAGDWLDEATLVFTARNLSAFPLTVTVRVTSVMTDGAAAKKTMQTVAAGEQRERF